jgi:hypothetical protein
MKVVNGVCPVNLCSFVIISELFIQQGTLTEGKGSVKEV